MKKVLLLGLLMFTTLAMSAQNVVKGVVTAFTTFCADMASVVNIKRPKSNTFFMDV